MLLLYFDTLTISKVRYYVQCGNNKCYFDYDLNEYDVNKAKILSINSDIDEIGGRAFQNCNSLDCTIQLSSSTIIVEKAFDNCGNLKIERIN